MQLLIAFTCGLICLLAVSGAPPSPEDMKKMKESLEKCIAETEVNPELLKSAKSGEGLDDKKLHCFGACMMQSAGVMDDAGNMNSEPIMSHLPEGVSGDDVMKMFDLCSKEKGSDKCETAGLMIKCIHENKGHELFRLPHE